MGDKKTENDTPESLPTAEKGNSETSDNVSKLESQGGSELTSDATAKENSEKAAKEAEKQNGEVIGEDLPLYPLPVKGPGGEEIELQVHT